MFQLFTSSFQNIIEYSLVTVFNVIGNLMVIVSKALNYAVFVRPGGNILVVETTWKILRDFSNMIFIILLIYMAFATIFDHGKYTFKDMIVRFLIVAVLINFSLVIGNLVIDFSQVLSNVFLGSIGNLGDRLGQYLNPSLLLPNNLNATDLAASSLVSLVFAIILGLVFLFSLLVAMVFAIIRVPFIWALLIVSPIAWMSHILPGTNKWWSQWWSLFLGWNLFLPVYLFFMYLGLIFLSKRDEIIGAVIKTNALAGAANPANAPLLEGVANSLSFNLVFFYIFAGIVMVGGTWAAKETTSWMGGTGFDKGLGWAKGLVKSVPLPYIGNLKAGEAASKARFNQFQQEGFKQGGFINKWTGGAANKMFGGKDAQTRADAKASDSRLFGGGVGARDAESSQFGKEVSANKARFTNMDTTQLQARMNSGPEKEQLAVRELLKERNQLTNTEQAKTYVMYRKNDEQAALKFANSIDYGKLSETERTDWLGRTTNVELKKKIVTSKAEKGDYNTAAEVVQASTLFTAPADRAAFIKKAANRLDVAETRDILSPAILGRAPTREEQVAVNEILSKKQALDGTGIINAYNQLGAGSEDGEKFLSSIKWATLDKLTRRELFDASMNVPPLIQIADIETKHKLFDAMAEKGEFVPDELEEAAKTYGGSEQKEFLTKAQKEKFVRTAEVRRRLSLLPGGTPIANLHESIVKQIEKLKPEDIAGLPKEDAWNEPAFITALENHVVGLQNQPRGGPQPPVLLHPALPFDPNTNPVVAPGKPGRGTKLRDELLAATRDNTKVTHINTIPVP